MNRLGKAIEKAISEGILPPDAAAPSDNERPWPVVLLTAIGAWLAALPLLAALFMLLGEAVFRSPGAYIIGIIGIASSVALLRVPVLPLFVEQLAVPALLTGGMALGIALSGDLTVDWGAAVMTVISLGIAIIIPRGWLRTLLGAAACVFATMASGATWNNLLPHVALYGLLGVTALWLLMQWLAQQLLLSARRATALASVANGWLLATLAGLAFWSGMTFLAGASVDPFGGELENTGGGKQFSAASQLASLLLAGSAAAWIGRSWPALRQPWSALAALVVIALAWLMPSLGPVLLILAVCAVQSRWRLAATAALAAAWIIGAFYYQLALPLATKALIMAVSGAVLGALAWLALCGKSLETGKAPVEMDSLRARVGIAASAIAVLLIANIGIWQKQTLIAQGKPVFVELGPVDPRSLMQGDYMRLTFVLPPLSDIRAMQGARRPMAIGKLDARGVATLQRVAVDALVAPGEIAIELTPHAGAWTLVTDAWYFGEGEASRWESAKYGEFRVAPDGRALLISMRGPQLEPL